MEKNNSHYLYITLISALFFLPFLGGVHLFDWDEINFAEVTREMIISENYLKPSINFQPFWEKPPLFFWLQSIGMQLFGIGEYGARFPNAVTGIITLVLLYFYGKKTHNKEFAWFWSLSYFGSILPFLYFKSGIIDPVFNLFIFLGFHQLFLTAYRSSTPSTKYTHLALAGLFTGLGVLTKGPVAFLIICLGLGVWWILKRFRFFITPLQFIFYTFITLLTTGVWFGIDIIQNGWWFTTEFITYQIRLFSTPDAGHGGFPGYHFVVLLVGCFPASIFALGSIIKKQPGSNLQQQYTTWMKVLFWVVLILFTIVKSKIVHYSSLAYFPLTYLSALTISQLLERRQTLSKWQVGAIAFFSTLFITVTASVPFLAQSPQLLKQYIAQPFAAANLNADIHWPLWTLLPAVILLTMLITFLRFHRLRQTNNAITSLFLGIALFMMVGLISFIKRVENISQNAAISFYESIQDEDCYVIPHGFKSYAHLFYFDKQPLANKKGYNREWLYHGDIDKDVYVVTKLNKVYQIKKMKEFVELRRENGFVFFKRYKKR